MVFEMITIRDAAFVAVFVVAALLLAYCFSSIEISCLPFVEGQGIGEGK